MCKARFFQMQLTGVVIKLGEHDVAPFANFETGKVGKIDGALGVDHKRGLNFH